MNSGSIIVIVADNEHKRIKEILVVLLIVIFWAILISSAYFTQVRSAKSQSMDLALNECISTYNSDINFRQWTAMHGGLYVPITEELQPNPYLKHIPDQNITAPSGKNLTLMNPAWLIRSLYEYEGNPDTVKSHITSLKVIRPENEADEWEKRALRLFEDGQKEMFEKTTIDDHTYFRYMKPMYIEQGCLKCHGYQNYEVGDICGGISVSVSYDHYLETENKKIEKTRELLLFLYLTVFLLIIVGALLIIKRNRIISTTRSMLIKSNTTLEKEVMYSKKKNEELTIEIAERQKLDKELKEALNIINRSSYIIILWNNDADLTIDFVSGNVEGMLGYTPEELKEGYILFSSIIDPEDRDRVLHSLTETILENSESEIQPFRILTKNGLLKWLDCKVTIRSNSDGTNTHIEGILSDITNNMLMKQEKEKLQSQLDYKTKMDGLGQLAGGIAHDFNNILQGISSSAELLEISKNDSEEYKQSYITKIIQASKKASDLTEKLMTYSRKDTIAFKNVCLHKIIDESLALITNSINKKIQIKVNQSAEHHIVFGNKTGLENAIINLILNASHAIKGNGEIQISTRNIHHEEPSLDSCYNEIQPGNYCEVEVKDTGSGIPKDKMDKIFEPFYTTKKNGEGRGLGLTSVYSIVQNHKGSLNYTSEVDKGSAFRFALPYLEDTIAEQEKESTVQKGSGFILLVDDEEMNQDLVSDILKTLGYKVLVAVNGRDALEKYKANYPNIDIVLLDMIMPEMDGKETFKRLQEFDKNCKVIISSGYTKNESIDELIKSGLKGFISKPYQMSELSQILESVSKEK